MISKTVPILIACFLFQQVGWADVSYQETTQITGGSLKSVLKLAGSFSSQARQANSTTVTTIALHGNLMARKNIHSTEIVNLDKQTITFIDHDKHTYSIATFQQIQQSMAKAAAGAKQNQRSTSPQDPAGSAQMSFNAHASSNGTTRTINGQEAKEALLTITMLANANDSSNVKGGMAATSEMWLVPEIPGIAELRAFNRKLAMEFAFDMSASQMSGMLAAQPGGAEALADLKKEAAKMAGVPVLQVTRVGVSTDGKPLAAPSVAPLNHGQQRQSATGDAGRGVAADAGEQTANRQTNKLGGFGNVLGSSPLGSLMRHRSASPSPSPGAGPGDSSTAEVLLESQTELSGFSSTPIDPATFEVPASYKPVPSPILRE